MQYAICLLSVQLSINFCTPVWVHLRKFLTLEWSLQVHWTLCPEHLHPEARMQVGFYETMWMSFRAPALLSCCWQAMHSHPDWMWKLPNQSVHWPIAPCRETGLSGLINCPFHSPIHIWKEFWHAKANIIKYSYYIGKICHHQSDVYIYPLIYLLLCIRSHEIMPSPRVNPGSSSSDSQHFWAETRAHYDLSTRLVASHCIDWIGTNSRSVMILYCGWATVGKSYLVSSCDNQKGFTPALWWCV